MSRLVIRTILEEYAPHLPDDIESKVQEYLRLLDIWGKKMPLTSIKDPEEILRFHFGESISALSTMDVTSGRLADVGSGAGFPGLAIKLAKPQLDVLLIEPNKKKSAFLHEVVRTLHLTNVRIATDSFYETQIQDNSLSLVTCRALGDLEDLIPWAKRKLAISGKLVLWVGKEESTKTVSSPGWRWRGPTLIPGTRGRFVLSGAPIIEKCST